MQNESEKQSKLLRNCPQSIFVAMDLVNALSSAFNDTAAFSKKHERFSKDLSLLSYI